MRLKFKAAWLTALLLGSSFVLAAPPPQAVKVKQRPAAQQSKNKAQPLHTTSVVKRSASQTATAGKAMPKASARTPASRSSKLAAKPSGRSTKLAAKPAKRALAQLAEEWQVSHNLAVNSASALVFDQVSGDAIFQKNAGAVTPIASITKLMTAMVVLDGAPNLQAQISIAEDDIDYLRGSRSRLHVGSVFSRETALLLALMSSENRAAHALARHYPGGFAAFVAAMNAKARALGMHDTRFDDPTGLSRNNVSTARDLARMVSAAYRYPLIREWSTTSEATVDVSGKEQIFRNTNPLVKSPDWAVGLSKTGYIHEAGRCLVMQAWLAEKPVVIVLLDSNGKLTRVGDANRIKRWMEHVHASHKGPTHAAMSAGRAG